MESHSINFDKYWELCYICLMYRRTYEPLDDYIQPGKVLLIHGPRRTGKTTLLQHFLSTTTLKYKFESGDNIQIQQILGSQDFSKIIPFIEGYDLLAIDEAQNIPNIELALKIIVDQVPNIHVITTGSSSFELAGQVGEPLTGRKRTLILYPLSQNELLNHYNQFELQQKLEEFLIFGSYPEVLSASKRSMKIEAILEIANSHLLKDILAFDRIKNSRAILHLIQLLAFQVGSEVSINELATQVGADTKTIARYLDLLEKSFVIIRLNGFSRNLRQEITNKSKYYFFDNGIRNAVVAQFNPLEQRNDTGSLWENFIFAERMKLRSYSSIVANTFFWRTYDQKEIDLVEEREGDLFGYEFKWATQKVVSSPKLWQQTYPKAKFFVINPDNYFEFITNTRKVTQTITQAVT